MEYYSTMKNKILIHTTVRANLENILGAKSWSQKAHRIGKSTEIEIRLVIAEG